MTPQSIVVIAMIPLLAWRMYSRVRRLVGRQRSRAWRHWSAHIGIALSVLLVARIAWRVVEVQLHGAAPGGAQFASSPLTLVAVGMLAAYYTVYAAGLLRWRRSSR